MILEVAHQSDITARIIGTTGGDALTLKGKGTISVADLTATNEAWLPDFMSAPDANA